MRQRTSTFSSDKAMGVDWYERHISPLLVSPISKKPFIPPPSVPIESCLKPPKSRLYFTVDSQMFERSLIVSALVIHYIRVKTLHAICIDVPTVIRVSIRNRFTYISPVILPLTQNHHDFPRLQLINHNDHQNPTPTLNPNPRPQPPPPPPQPTQTPAPPQHPPP